MQTKPLIAALLAAVTPAVAAETATELGVVRVIAPRIDARSLFATTLKTQAIAPLLSATSDTASLLRDIPGVSLYGAGAVSSLPAIRGLADERVRLTVDGMDLYAACPNHMNTPLSYLDPTQVEAVSVWAGVAPVSTGGDAIGGSIVVESAAPVFAASGERPRTEGRLGTFYRSNGDAWGANLGARYATDVFSLDYAGATAESDNYQAGRAFKTYDFTGRAGHTLTRDEVGSTAYRTRNHSLGAAYKSGGHLLEAKLLYQDMPYQLYPNQRMDMLDNESVKLNLRYRGRFDWGHLDARVYHETIDHFMDFGADKRYWYGSNSGGISPPGGNATPCSPIGPTCAAGMPMYTDSRTTGATLKAELPITSRDLLRLGAELQRYRLDDRWPPSGAGMWPNTFWNIRDGERDRYGLFGEWEARAGTQWLTLAGLRLERVETDAAQVLGYIHATPPTSGTGGMGNQTRDAVAFNNADRSKRFNNWDLSLLARYTVSPMLDIEFGFAHKARAPSLYELYPWSTWQMAALMNNFVGDGNGYIGNLNLKPEKANTLSATFDWHATDRAWAFKATPFYTRVTDYIDAVQWDATTNAPRTLPVVNNFTVLKYMNHSARLYGLDLSGRLPLARNEWGEFGLKGLLNYTHGKNRTTGDGLYNVMPLNAKLTLTHKRAGWDNALEVVMVEGKDDVSRVRNEIGTPGYSLVNLRGSYAWKQARLDFGVENLFDRFYRLPTGGAYVGQGTTMSIPPLPNQPQWGTAVPGPGRSVYAGLNISF